MNQLDIYFIERCGRKTLIHTLEKIILIYESLNAIQKKLNSTLFTRIHRSYLVNRLKICKIGKPIGRTREIIFKDYAKSAYVGNSNLEKLKLMLNT